MRAVARGIPLPFASIDNRRSLVAIDNLVSFLVLCLAHPRAANEAFLVSDGEDLSTGDLVRRVAAAIGKRARLFPVPPRVLVAAATLFGQRDLALRLAGTLQVDITKARTLLGWTPPLSVDAGLSRLAAP
jgi:nucleoside-diphosphate-sugar epimerase